ncbi:MAG: AAA family ATPase [Candidatus Doudnabacteria bacterium]|nr:AAA family ATPase [Candidatus Doudnabacteria bacterium]
MDKKTILAVVGLAGAGKTETTEYLIKKTNWPKVYFGGVVMDEVAKRGLEVNEANERLVREELRATHGMAAMAILSIPKIKELFAASSVILESMYSWEEYLVLKEAFGEDFKVLAIFSSSKTRTARMINRPIRPLTPELLQSRDYSQIENLHQAGPIARADWTIINEGSKEDLYKNLDEIIKELA